jgi:hypothetical protein
MGLLMHHYTPVHRRRAALGAQLPVICDLPAKIIKEVEAGRRQPLLFEAKKLAGGLGMSLDDLAIEQEELDDGWRMLCEVRSSRKALIFRARARSKLRRSATPGRLRSR